MAERNVAACAKLDGKVQDALSWTNVEDPVLLVHVADTVLVTTMKPHPLPFVNVSRAIGKYFKSEGAAREWSTGSL